MKFYIINDFDQPSERFIVNQHGKYCDEGLGSYHFSNLSDAVSLEDFGFDTTLTSEGVIFQQVRESVAKYSDGKPRQWQGSVFFTKELKWI